jgi:sarcosine oxidase subunit gamma
MWNDRTAMAGDQLTSTATSPSKQSQRSPLAHLTGANIKSVVHRGECLTITERAFLELVIVRGDSRAIDFRQAVEVRLGATLPLEPNSTTFTEKFIIAWMGPDEWLVQSHKGATNRDGNSGVKQALSTELAGQFASAVDVSSGYTTLRVEGVHTEEILARGCPLDLHSSVFFRGRCAQSHFFKAPVFVLSIDDQTVDLVIRRSFSEYITTMLIDAVDSLN